MPKDEIREEDKKCSSKFVSLALFLRTHACHFQKNNLVYNAQWSKKWKKWMFFITISPFLTKQGGNGIAGEKMVNAQGIYNWSGKTSHQSALLVVSFEIGNSMNIFKGSVT